MVTLHWDYWVIKTLFGYNPIGRYTDSDRERVDRTFKTLANGNSGLAVDLSVPIA